MFSTLASEQELIRIIENDNELLPNSKQNLKDSVRYKTIETLEQLYESIAIQKNLYGRL